MRMIPTMQFLKTIRDIFLAYEELGVWLFWVQELRPSI